MIERPTKLVKQQRRPGMMGFRPAPEIPIPPIPLRHPVLYFQWRRSAERRFLSFLLFQAVIAAASVDCVGPMAPH